MTESRTLQVLAEFGGIAVGDVKGMANPVVILNDDAMSNILLLLRDVQEKGSVIDAESSLAFNKLVAAVEAIVE